METRILLSAASLDLGESSESVVTSQANPFDAIHFDYDYSFESQWRDRGTFKKKSEAGSRSQSYGLHSFQWNGVKVRHSIGGHGYYRADIEASAETYESHPGVVIREGLYEQSTLTIRVNDTPEILDGTNFVWFYAHIIGGSVHWDGKAEVTVFASVGTRNIDLFHRSFEADSNGSVRFDGYQTDRMIGDAVTITFDVKAYDGGSAHISWGGVNHPFYSSPLRYEYDGDWELAGFRQSVSDLSLLEIEYTVTSPRLNPLVLTFAGTSDPADRPSLHFSTIATVNLSPETVASSPYLVGLKGEASTEVLTEGTHTLLVRPIGTVIERALFDPGVERLFVAQVYKNSEGKPIANPWRDFEGAYQANPGSAAVLRTTGNAYADSVVVGQSEVIASRSSAIWATAKFRDPSSITILTGTGDDEVIVGPMVSTPVAVYTSAGNDRVIGGRGDDTIRGGQGRDILLGEGFDATVGLPDVKKWLEALGRGEIVSLASAAVGMVGRGDDLIEGGDGFDIVIGGDGDDVIDGGAGPGVIFGDTLRFNADVTFDFGQFFENATSAILSAHEHSGRSLFADSIGAGLGLFADGSGDDVIRGGDSLDLIVGGAGDDILVSGGGLADVILGGNDDDRIHAEDTQLLFAHAGSGNDYIVGASRNNIIFGGDGDDEVFGADRSGRAFAGVDLLIGDDYEFGISSIADFLAGLQRGKLDFHLEANPTGTGDDTLHGLAGTDVLIGGSGSDELNGGDGGGLLIGDELYLGVGSGTDSVEFTDLAPSTKSFKSIANAAMKLLAIPTVRLQGDSNDADDLIVGGAGFDVAFGSLGDDVIYTGGGAGDIAFGNDGDDTIQAAGTRLPFLVGGAGSDILDANDTPEAHALGGIFLGDGFEFHGIPVSAIDLLDIEFSGFWPVKLGIAGGWTEAGSGDDVIYSNTGGFNVVIGGSGDDAITTAGAFDIVLGDTFNAGINIGVDFSGVKSTNSLAENFAAIETSFQLPGLTGDGNAVITAEDGILIAHAGGGNDVVYGGDVFSLIDGGDGDDKLYGRSGEFSGTDGFDVLIGGRGDDGIRGNSNSNVLLGDGVYFGPKLPSLSGLKKGDLEINVGLVWYGSGDDTIHGGDGFDFIVGGSGSDLLNGRQGTNVMFGDTFNLSTSLFSFRRLFTSTFESLLFDRAERIVKVAENLFRPHGSGNDRIIGGTGTDIVFGGDGDDTISGGSGDFNLLIGGSGTDKVFSNRNLDFIFD